MVRFIHSADWQLGMTRHFLSSEAQGRYSEARLESIRRIAELATSEACNFVVVGGDVFESNQVDRQVAARALDAFASFEVPVFLLPGNHDPLLGAGSIWDSPAFLQKCPANIAVLRNSEPSPVAGCDAEVVGAVWRSKAPVTDLVAQALAPLDVAQRTRILVGHGIVDQLSPAAGDPETVFLASAEQAIADGRVHFVALGDRHSVTDLGDTGRIWYSGTPLMTDYDEVDPNKVLLIEIDGDRCEVQPRVVGDWTFAEHKFDLNGDEDIDDVRRWFDELSDKRRCVVKLSFVGTVTLRTKAQLDRLLEENEDLLAALEVSDRRSDLAVLPDDEDFANLGFGGFVASTVEELKELASSGDDSAAAAQDALGLLFRLSESTQ